jgi:uncharacterized damage-inducible protein DinB
MNPLLVDLARHQSWADAEFWRALEQCEPATNDQAIRDRLHHLHLVQRGFLWLASGKNADAFEMSTPRDFPTLKALREFGERSSRDFAAFLEAMPDQRLDDRLELPWFPRDPPFSVTVTEALTQAVMHSQWHRGQNATRLRELGGDPPTIDLIIWYWKERPAAAW